MDLTERLAREPNPTKWLCRLRLCFASKRIYHGEATFEETQKKNRPPERAWGIYHINECADCGRVVVKTIMWASLNGRQSAAAFEK